MRLSKNFQLSEFLKSSHGFLITPSDYDIENLKRICTEILQPLRDEFEVPIKITSGLRSIGSNAVVGGKESSLHLEGKAVDFKVKDPYTLIKMYDFACRHLPYNKICYYNRDVPANRFIHVDLLKENNKHYAFICEYGQWYFVDFWLKQAFGV